MLTGNKLGLRWVAVLRQSLAPPTTKKHREAVSRGQAVPFSSVPGKDRPVPFHLKQLIQANDCFRRFGRFRVIDVFGQRVHKRAAQVGMAQVPEALHCRIIFSQYGNCTCLSGVKAEMSMGILLYLDLEF